jgi:fucose permease
MQTRATAIPPLIAFVVLGLPAGALGVAWPHMRASLGAPLAGLGLLLTVSMITYFFSEAATGALATRLGAPTLLMGTAAVAASALLLFGLASQWWQAVIAAALLGGASGPLDAVVNAHVAMNHGVRVMGWLHASWALGATLGPQTVAIALILTGSWRASYLAMALAFIALLLLVGSWQSGWRPPGLARAPAVDGTNRRASLPVLLLLAALFFLYVGIEWSAGQWAYTQLTTSRGVPAAIAGLGVSLYWAGLAAGRVALGVFGNRFAPNRILDLAVGITAGGALAFWLAPPLLSTFVGLPLIGAGLSVMVPLLISLIPSRVGPSFATAAIGYQAAAGTIGGAALPGGIGLFMQWWGPLILGPALFLLTGLLGAIHLVTQLTLGRNKGITY